MRNLRRHLAFPLLVACGAVAGCSSDPAPDAPDLAAQLERDTGTKWTVYIDPRSKEVRFLAPKTPVQLGAGTPEEKARAFFTRYKATLHASGSADEIRVASTATDARGGSHIRFEHYLPGTELKVFGAGSTAHFTADGAIYWLESDFRADIAGLDAAATVTDATATATALAHVRSACGPARRAPTASGAALGIFADPERPSALAYRVFISADAEGCIAPSVFVDAKSGEVLRVKERAHAAASPKVEGSRFFRAHDSTDTKSIDITFTGTSAAKKFSMISEDERTKRVITHSFADESTPIETPDPKIWDGAAKAEGAAVDAHFNARMALPFLRAFAEFSPRGRADTPPLGFDVHVIVHDNTLDDGANAFGSFDVATGRDTVRFGDGNFPAIANALPWSAAYDMVAHELTHIITDHTSALEYENESGALNESFSDAMGAAAEHAAFPSDAKNFLIGEDLYIAGQPGPTALRSMTAPLSLGSPDHTDKQVRCAPGARPDRKKNDFCGVHSNSGIPNRAFSLIVAGGSLFKLVPGQAPVRRPIGVPNGIGWEKANQLTYWATTGLTSTATFQNAALAQIAEAAAVGGVAAAETVTCAWYAVGVFVPSTPVEGLALDQFCQPPSPPSPPAPPPPPPPGSGIVGNNVCAGHGDALVCDPAVPAQAIVCKNGSPAVPPATAFCADPTQTCKRTSGADPTAVLQDGAIVCE